MDLMIGGVTQGSGSRGQGKEPREVTCGCAGDPQRAQVGRPTTGRGPESKDGRMGAGWSGRPLRDPLKTELPLDGDQPTVIISLFANRWVLLRREKPRLERGRAHPAGTGRGVRVDPPQCFSSSRSSAGIQQSGEKHQGSPHAEEHTPNAAVLCPRQSQQDSRSWGKCLFAHSINKPLAQSQVQPLPPGQRTG